MTDKAMNKVRRLLTKALDASYGCTSATCGMNQLKEGQVGTANLCRCKYVFETMLAGAKQIIDEDGLRDENSGASAGHLAQSNEPMLINMGSLAKKLGVSRATLWRWEKEWGLKPILVGNSKRYVLKDVETFIRSKGNHGK